jgi:putative endonuclease
MSRSPASQPKRLRSKALGRYGEDVAARYLGESGIVVIDRNWRGPSGEIDVVGLDGPTLVICEVKTRTGDRYGGPIAAITPEKLQRLRRLAGEWISDHRVAIDGVRIDIVGIWRPKRGPADVRHLIGVQ